MRKLDKKLNIQKVNILAERVYLKNKGLLEENLGYGFQQENQGMCEDPLGECGMGMYEEPTPMYEDPMDNHPMQQEMEYEEPMPIYEEPHADLKNTLRQMEPRDIQGKEAFYEELKSFMKELNYVIRREKGER